jgi:hypothetical protein
MPKILYPPQAGERNLCLSVFCTMMMSIVAAVLIIYAIVIIYLPAKIVLESTLQGPKMCTTLSKEGNLTGEEVCLGWTSCHEWCLSVVSKNLPNHFSCQTFTCNTFRDFPTIISTKGLEKFSAHCKAYFPVETFSINILGLLNQYTVKRSLFSMLSNFFDAFEDCQLLTVQ